MYVCILYKLPIADRDQGEANEYERDPENQDDHQEDGVRLRLRHEVCYAPRLVRVRGYTQGPIIYR